MKNLKFALIVTVLLVFAGCSGSQNDMKSDVFAGKFSAESHLQASADLKSLIAKDAAGETRS